jgi:hypothetical protein
MGWQHLVDQQQLEESCHNGAFTAKFMLAIYPRLCSDQD